MTIAPNPRSLALLAALTSALSGLWALVAWALDEWHLVSLGADYVPMAPPTALLFAVLGLALAAQERWPESPRAHAACQVAAGLSLLGGGLVLLQGWFGFTLPWTGWLVAAPASVGSIPVGLMSPVTAVCFLFTAVALLGHGSHRAARPLFRRATFAANGVVLAVAGLVALSYVTRTPLFYEAGIVPMALLTALTFLALNGSLFLSGLLDRLLQKWRVHDTAAHVPDGGRDYTRRLLLVGGALGGLIIVAGVLYLRRAHADARAVVYSQLEAIARLKTGQIQDWRTERMGEARFLYHTSAVVQDIAAFAAQPGDPAVRARVIDWLEPIKGGDRYYSLTVLDSQARPLLTIPAAATNPGDCITPALFAQAWASQGPMFTDLQRDPGDPAPHLALLVPIHPRTGPDGRQAPPVAVIVMRLDPRHFLFPLIQSWPLPSATAETLLIRREGDEVVFLNEVRHRADAALTIRRSLQEPNLPASRAGLGKTGVQEGVDYRGVPVLSAIRPIPDSPWILIAKMDLTEAYGAIQRDAWHTGLAVLFLLLAIGLAGTSLWRWRHAEFLRRALATEQERQALAERLGLVMRHANDCIFLMDAAGRILDANDRALDSYGYTLEEFRSMPAGGLRPPATSGGLPDQIKALASENGAVFETEHRRKDGSVFPVEVSGRQVTIGGRPQLLGIYRDISQRKAHEREIERLNRMYLVISQVNQTIVRARSQAGLFPDICRVLVEFGKFRMAWIGWPNHAVKQLMPVAVAGDAHDDVREVKISFDPAVPGSRGLSGTAFREGRTCVSNDILADPTFRPWHELSKARGLKSAISLPLRQDGTVRGVLNVYAAEKDFFGPQNISLLEEAAGDVSFALEVFDGEARRQEAEAAVRASESRLQFLITSTPAIIYSLRADGSFATNFLSPNIREVLGYEAEQIIADPSFWPAHLHPDDASSALAARDTLLRLAGSATITREYRFRHADGTWRWMQDETRVVRDASGRALELVGYWVDINQRKEAEERLQSSEKEFRSLAEAMPQIVWVTRADGWNIYFNQQWVDYTGLSFKESHGHGWNIPFHPDDRQRAWDAWQHATKHGTIYSLEARLRRADGAYRWWLVRGVPLCGADGAINKWFGTCTDIEDIKQAETARQQSQARLQSIFRAAPVGIGVVTDRIIQETNEVLCRMTGYARDELLGRSARMLYPTEEEFALVGREKYRQIAEKGTGTVETLWRRKNGELIQVLLSSTPFDAADLSAGVTFTAMDITARKQGETALRESQAFYHALVEQLPAGVFRKDPEGRFVFVSPGFCRLKGMQAEDFLGKTPGEVAGGPAARRDALGRASKHAREGEEDHWRLMASDQPIELVEEYPAADGGKQFLHVIKTPVIDQTGKTIGTQGIQFDITEFKRAEIALRESENLLREAQNIARLGSYELDIATGRWRSSTVLDRVFGIGPDYDRSVAGWENLIHPGNQADMRRYFQEEVLGRKQLFDREYRIVRQTDRAERWVWGTGRLDCDAAGGPIRMHGTIQDITERKQAELELQKLSRVVEQSPTSVIITDLKGAIEYVNPWFCRLTGYTAGEVLGQNPRLLKSGDTSPEVYRDMWQTLSASRIWRGELHNRKKNGELYIELAVIAPVFGPDGCPSHFVAIKDDITERKRLEALTRQTLEQFNAELEQKVDQRTEELAVQARQMQALLDSIPDTVMRLRADGTILHSQPAHLGGAALFGVTPPEDAPTAAGAPAALLAASLELGRQALAAGATTVGETELTTPGGTLALELRTAPTGTDEFVVFARDITARKRLEEETAAMLEKERQVSEMKTRFIAVISHEFRTPMTAIAGSVELLANHLDRLTAEKRADILERINRSQLRMTAMLDDVLMLNRMDANHTEVRLATVNLEPFVQNIISEVRAADHDTHPFALHLPWPARTLVTDPNLLHHILANLLGNAVRYSPAGSIVTLGATSDAWRLYLSVEDHGIGIPPGDRVRIFEPFERGSNVGQIKGTGLGLNIVKRLTELLGGNVSLRQTAGGGTRFTLAFPLLPTPDSTP